jgi:hypothetical protein
MSTLHQQVPTASEAADPPPRASVQLRVVEPEFWEDPEAAARVVVSPDPVIARSESTITWHSPYPFVIRFDGASPLRGGVEVRSPAAEEAGFDRPFRYEASATMRTDAARVERYKYSLALGWNGQILIADPDVVVEPDPPIRIGG